MRDFAILMGCVGVIWIIGDSIVRIIKAAKTGGKKATVAFQEYETRIEDLEVELDDAKSRIEVLERIVTDEKHQLNAEIDKLNQA